MATLHDHPAEPLPVAKVHVHHGHVHHEHEHHEHTRHGHNHGARAHVAHNHDAAQEHRVAPKPRFSLIALSALQRLALVAPAILGLGLLALWATQNG